MDKLFFDGAYGTYLLEKNLVETFPELLNITSPGEVEKVHREYLNIGVNAVKTNTFGANRTLGVGKETIKKVITCGYDIAQNAARDFGAKVFCDIGPVNEAQEGEYEFVADCFLNLHAKNFLLETFASVEEAVNLSNYISSKQKDAFIIVSFAVFEDGYTKKGYYYKDAFESIIKNTKASVVGLNCLCGPSHMKRLFQKIDVTNFKYIAMPNAGYPQSVGQRNVFQCDPSYFASVVGDLYSRGLFAVGGCCGTTPEHIKELYSLVDKSEDKSSFNEAKNEVTRNKAKAVLPFVSLCKGKMIAVELDPPKDMDLSKLIRNSLRTKEIGANIITFADNPLARSRADSVMCAAKIKRECHIEVMPHMACRDKNNLSIKSTLLSAAMEDVRFVLAVTGDPIVATNREEARGVFSFNSNSLVSFIRAMNNETLEDAPFSVGCALNINANNFSVELMRAKKKASLGANAFFTQPIYNQTGVENVKEAYSSLAVPIYAGIMPIASYRNALFLKNEVSGVNIDGAVVQSYKGKTAEECFELSVSYCKNFIEEVWDYCHGFYVMMPLERFDLVEAVVKFIRNKEDEN